MQRGRLKRRIINEFGVTDAQVAQQLLDRWISDSAGCIQLLKNLVVDLE
jgi:hypothetical protein